MALLAGAVPKTSDFLVVGGGIVGINVALVLRGRYPDATVAVRWCEPPFPGRPVTVPAPQLVEKETRPGEHASGRNSGVTHAGFYYSGDSLKARFCRDGNLWTRRYCKERGLRLNECGKLVVAQREDLIDGVRMLHQRGLDNGVQVELVSEAEARELEPLVKTHEVALWSPTTASADPGEVMSSLVDDALEAGVRVCCDAAYVSSRPAASGSSGARVETAAGAVEAGHVVNCAGLYADRVAGHFGVGLQYRMMPFKGLYHYLRRDRVPLRRHIYPTPDLGNPFLGVHFTVTVDGEPKIGPTAIPALWREQYGLFDHFSGREMLEIVHDQLGLFATDAFGFRRLAWREVAKYYTPNMVREAALLARGVDASAVRQYGRPGIRAQLLDTRTRELVMDFLVKNGPSSTHVLNAVSPGWTCARPFAEYVVSDFVEPGLAAQG